MSRVREPLVVAVAQPPCAAHDVAANALTHAAVVRSAGARVVVFPELSLTGYELAAAAVAAEDPRLAPLVTACADVGATALVGAPVRDGPTGPWGDSHRAMVGQPQGHGERGTGPGGTRAGGRPHIATLAVDGTGARVAYRKMWLGAAEAERFAPGDEPAVLEVDGWRLGLAICKDAGVAQHAADTAALGIDAYVAGTAEAEDDAGLQDERARRIALEHRIWVVIASFAGSTGGGYRRTAGRSTVWNADGVAVARAGPEPGAVARVTLV